MPIFSLNPYNKNRREESVFPLCFIQDDEDDSSIMSIKVYLVSAMIALSSLHWKRNWKQGNSSLLWGFTVK